VRGKRWDGGVPEKATGKSWNRRGGCGWAAVHLGLGTRPSGAAGGACAVWGCLDWTHMSVRTVGGGPRRRLDANSGTGTRYPRVALVPDLN
jgi:hypothetical protein